MREPPQKQKARVLIVDDEPQIRAVQARLLARAGYETRAVPSALQALETVREWPPDVIILDLKMRIEELLRAR